MFNTIPARFLHIDLNSCFASIEQQANPLYRGKPLAVAAYIKPSGCILAASREAKKLGIKTGMRVFEGLQIYPRLIVLDPDPNKYRFVSGKLLEVFHAHTPEAEMKSIDEAILDFQNWPPCQSLPEIALRIKKEIKQNIGDWLTVSIGISTNSYLAKLAAGLQKPDGLVEINSQNIEDTFSKLKLDDLPYIKQGNSLRLNLRGIFTPLDFLKADGPTLKSAFQSIVGYRWYQWLHGYEIEGITFGGKFAGAIDKTVGHSFAISHHGDDEFYLQSWLCQLVEKMGRRLRDKGFVASGIHVSCQLDDHTYWHHGRKLNGKVFENRELFLAALNIFSQRPKDRKVVILAVNVFDLEYAEPMQLSFLSDLEEKQKLAYAVDTINARWGDWSVTSALTLHTGKRLLDRIAFGKVNGSVI